MRDKRRNIIVFAVLILAAGTVYKIPYLRAVFYDQMISSLGVTHTELGILSSVYAGVKMVLYIPCGILADRLNTKRLLVFSLIGESILTGLYALIPAFWVIEMIQAGMALVNIFFWTSFIKSIRILGKDSSQGKIFGLGEGFRGITGSAATLVALQIVTVFAERTCPIRYVLIFYTVYYFLVGICIWKFYPNNLREAEGHRQTWRDYVEVMKKPAIWLVSLLIFTTYSMQVAFEYTTSYMTQVIGISAVTVGTVATLRDNICGVVGSPMAGAWADRIKSPTRVALYLLLIEIALCILLFFSPESREFGPALIGLILIISVVLYGVRGVYYSTMSETGIPVSLTATATAMVAVLGYTPDMFMTLWCGHILDTYGYQAGYHRIFGLMILFVCLAAAICVVMLRYQRRIAKRHCNSETGCIPGKIAEPFYELNKEKGETQDECKSKKMDRIHCFNAGCGPDLQSSVPQNRIL